MNQIISIFTFILILFYINPFNAYAISISGPAPHFIAEEIIDVKNEVNGEMLLIGQNITITKPINGDLFLIGENIYIDAPIKGDVRIIASSVEIKSRISGSLGFIAEKVLIPTTGEIDADAYGISSKFALYGRIGRDLNLGYAENSDILVEGNVAGNIHYLNNIPNLTSNSFLGGKLVKTDTSDFKSTEKDIRLQIILGKILHSLSLILIAILILKFFPEKFIKGFDLYSKNILRNLFYGVLAFLVFPLVLLELSISIIGIPIALLSSAIIMFLFYISPIYPAAFIGQKLLPQSKSTLIPIVCGILIFDVISMGPVVGSVLYTFSIITFLGLVFKTLLDLPHKKASN